MGAVSSRFRKAFSKHGAAGYPRKIPHKKGKMVFENTLERQTYVFRINFNIFVVNLTCFPRVYTLRSFLSFLLSCFHKVVQAIQTELKKHTKLETSTLVSIAISRMWLEKLSFSGLSYSNCMVRFELIYTKRNSRLHHLSCIVGTQGSSRLIGC